MADCNFLDKCDSGVIKEYMAAGKDAMEELLFIKLWQTTVAGDPTKGIAKTFTYIEEKSAGVVSAIEQNDIVYSGGIYQLGDIKVQLRILLREIDDATQCPGDRILWRGHEYRIVGRVATHYLGKYVLYDYVFRRI